MWNAKLEMLENSIYLPFFDIISTIHVIHDISRADRQDVINTLSQNLKLGGIFYIEEPVKKPHGILGDEIRALLFSAGLKEIESKETRSEYVGKYQKPEKC